MERRAVLSGSGVCSLLSMWTAVVLLPLVASSRIT
jgi:hypothetical protein